MGKATSGISQQSLMFVLFPPVANIIREAAHTKSPRNVRRRRRTSSGWTAVERHLLGPFFLPAGNWTI